MTNRLTEAEMIRALYFQRKGFTLTEIAERIGADRERVVRSLYWDLALADKVAA